MVQKPLKNLLLLWMVALVLQGCNGDRSTSPLPARVLPGINPSEEAQQNSTRFSQASARALVNGSEVRTQPTASIERVRVFTVGSVSFNMILLPEVTEEDVLLLWRTLNQGDQRRPTSIVVMPAFRAAETHTTVGLYRAVMGDFPDLNQTDLSEAQKISILSDWAANPDLPLTYTTSDEDRRFAARLSELTGEPFSIMTNSQNEYSMRGRDQDEQGQPVGPIVATRFFFGEEGGCEAVWAHAIVSDVQENSANVRGPTYTGAYGVRSVPEGMTLEAFTNNFGLIHPAGNVASRSVEGVCRGGAFDRSWEYARLHTSSGGYSERRFPNLGSRLALAF